MDNDVMESDSAEPNILDSDSAEPNAMGETMTDIFANLPKDKVHYNEPMKNHTTFKIGGPCRALFYPTNSKELAECIALCQITVTPYYLLGKGSNVLVSDAGYPGVIIKTDHLNQITDQGDGVFFAGAGQDLATMSDYFMTQGYTGFEFACGIPGSFGGAIYMNAGAYGPEIKDVVTEVCVLKDNQIVTYTNAQMQFGYRTSVIKNTNQVILGAKLQLQKADPADVQATIADLTERRESKQPLAYPSAGSVFKRPTGDFAGRLIQESGLVGYTIGGAQISEKHAGFIINRGDATAADVLALIAHVQQTVKAKFDVMLERELIVLS